MKFRLFITLSFIKNRYDKIYVFDRLVEGNYCNYSVNISYCDFTDPEFVRSACGIPYEKK